MLGNDSDADGDPLRVLAVAEPGDGSAVINPLGQDQDTVTYTPNGCFVGVDTFQYSITDGNGGSAIAQISADLTGLASHVGDDLVLSGQTIGGTETYLGCNSISAGDGLTLAPTADVVFRAGYTITLGTGFRVESGARLVAIVDPDLPASAPSTYP